MKASRKRTYVSFFLPLGLGLIIVSLFSGCFVSKRIFHHQVIKYSGDGKITNESFSFLVWYVRGYSVRFSDFAANHNFSAKYMVAKLPNAKDSIIVYLNLDIPPDKSLEQENCGTEARLKVNIYDSSHKIVYSLNKPLDQFTWTDTYAAGARHTSLYFYGNSGFRPKKNEKYLIEFNYQPSSAMKDVRAHLSIDSGGYI